MRLRGQPRVHGLALIAILLFSFFLALVWALMWWQERKSFDAAVDQVALGMTEQEVVRILGQSPARLASEQELDAYQRRAREWYSDFGRPLRVADSVLAFTANERKAYVYLDAQGRVHAVLLAKKGGKRQFEIVVNRADDDAGATTHGPLRLQDDPAPTTP